MTLRQDRQWMIYQEPSVRAAIFAVQIITSTLAGEWMERHHDLQVRAMGHVAGSLAESQLRYGLGLVQGEEPDEFVRTATEHAAVVLAHLANQSDHRTATALDELHAAVFWLDARLKGAGIKGGDWYRDLAKKGLVL